MAKALLGTVELIREPESMAAAFEALVRTAMSRGGGAGPRGAGCRIRLVA